MFINRYIDKEDIYIYIYTIALISHASKVMLKFSKPGFKNLELPDVQARFRKGRGIRGKKATTNLLTSNCQQVGS